MFKALLVMCSVFPLSCRADQDSGQKENTPSSDELKLCVSHNSEQMTCIYSKHGQWTLSLRFPHNKLSLNSYVELKQSESCRFSASYAEPGQPAFRSCIDDRQASKAYASFEVAHIEETKIVLKDLNMLLLDNSGEKQRQLRYERLEFKRQPLATK